MGVIRALSCVDCKLEFPKDWQEYLGGGKIPIPHFTTPARRPPAFIELTASGNYKMWVRYASITTIAKAGEGSCLLLIDKPFNVRETPEQIISLIDSASPSQGRSDAPPA